MATFAAVLRSRTRLPPGGTRALISGSDDGRDAAQEGSVVGDDGRGAAGADHADRHALDDADVEPVRRMRRRLDVADERIARDGREQRVLVDVQRGHVARGGVERGAHRGAAEAARAGHAHLVDADERGVAQPHPPADQGDGEQHDAGGQAQGDPWRARQPGGTGLRERDASGHPLILRRAQRRSCRTSAGDEALAERAHVAGAQDRGTGRRRAGARRAPARPRRTSAATAPRGPGPRRRRPRRPSGR